MGLACSGSPDVAATHAHTRLLWLQRKLLLSFLWLQRTLLLSLEEMYHGCIKKVVHERRVVKADGTSTAERRELTIDVDLFSLLRLTEHALPLTH